MLTGWCFLSVGTKLEILQEGGICVDDGINFNPDCAMIFLETFGE